MAITDATFRAGGLASGLDSNSIIDQLIKIEGRPVEMLKARQTGLRTQVSTLGDVLAKLSSLKSSAQGLGNGGALATKIEGTHTGFSATSGTSASAGAYNVRVNTLATAAQQRSSAFTGTDLVRGGSLTLGVRGSNYNVAITDGAALTDVAAAIRASGAPVSATVINDGTSNYLSVTARDTGFPLTGVAGDALSIVENYTGSGANKTITFTESQPPVNALITVDNLPITRTSNTIGDVIDGVTLNLKALTATSESLVVSNDQAGTTTNLTKFIDSYNSVIGVIQKQLQATASSDRSSTLLGDSTLRGLQRSLQGLITVEVGVGTVRSLADIGIKSARDGSLSVDGTVLKNALTRDPVAVNTLFADATAGLAKVTGTTIDNYSNAADGILITKRKGIESTVRDMDGQIASLELRLEGRRQSLIAQFTTMEKIVSSMSSLGRFLSQQTASGGQT